MNRITINGTTINVPSGNVSVINNQVYVNGKQIDVSQALGMGYIAELHITGDPLAVQSDIGVTVNGTVKGNVRAGNGVSCGDVSGNVHAGNSIHCGNVGGDADAGNSIHKRG